VPSADQGTADKPGHTLSLIGLAVAVILSAWVAGSGITPPALRVIIGGGLAMAVTALAGQLFSLSRRLTLSGRPRSPRERVREDQRLP
jgi:hypothetical protein